MKMRRAGVCFLFGHLERVESLVLYLSTISIFLEIHTPRCQVKLNTSYEQKRLYS